MYSVKHLAYIYYLKLECTEIIDFGNITSEFLLERNLEHKCWNYVNLTK